MPLYHYEARTKEGKKISGIRQAETKETLISILQKEDAVVLSVKLASKTMSGPKRRFSHSGVRGSDLVVFARQLGVMLEAGVTLDRALGAIISQTDSQKFFTILQQVKNKVEGGASFAQAISIYPKVFPALWVSMVETGEASGKLNFVLLKLSHYLEIKLNFKNTVVTSLFYPVVLFVAAIGALIFFVLKIIPTLTDLFKSFSIELPWITQVMINTSDFLKGKILFLLLGFILVLISIWQLSKIPVINKRLWQILFKLPLFGNLVRTLTTEQFLSQMGILVESGVAILHSLEITHRSIENPILKEIINSIKFSVKSGSSLSQPVAKSGFFDPMVIQMISTGEESGNLALMLEKISQFYEEYVRTFLERFSRIFEPLMIIIMGVGVGVLVVSMYLPIFQIATLGGGLK